MFEQDGIQFSNSRGWEQLEEHIEVHKYFLSNQLNKEVTWDEAVYSWYDTILRRLRHAIESWEFRSAFPRQPLGDLYLAVSDHWHYLKQRDANTTPEEAARSFASHYGKGLGKWFSRFLMA
mgnify:CR=1 FL=1